MKSSFGDKPYTDAKYGMIPDIENLRSGLYIGDEGALKRILHKLQIGESSAIDELVPYLVVDDADLRQYAYKLFAHSCGHSKVNSFADVLDLIDLEPREAQRLANRMGETNSLLAIPLLIRLMELFDCDSEDVNQTVFDNIRILYYSGHNVSELLNPRKRHEFVAQIEDMDLDLYYYKGAPINITQIGVRCLEVVEKAIKINSILSIYSYELVLSNFSGHMCPVRSGSKAKTDDIENFKSYLNTINTQRFTIGCKYFYEHKIE